MAWDLKLVNDDLAFGLVSGAQEILQRLRIRLIRELGEWFMNTESGLPWYQNGNGILGANYGKKTAVDMLIRARVLETSGVSRVLQYSGVFAQGGREYSIKMLLLLDTNEQAEFYLTSSDVSRGK